MKPKTIKIDDQEYIAVSEIKEKAESYDGMEYVIIRTYSAGCFAGYLKKRDGKEVELAKARRLWYWSGASSLSQLSIDGVANPGNCKFPEEVEKLILTEAIEIIPCTKKAKKSIADVKIWKQ
jgi:hypothetical protein